MNLSVDTLMAWLQASAGNPWMLAAALALATLATEDGTLIVGSLLVGSGIASPSLVIAALAFGITVGDIGLYAAGWGARSNKFLRKRLPVKKSRGLRRWLNGKETAILFFSRFMPGTRFVTYVTFGFLKLSLVRFASVMTIASIIWVTMMVLFISEIQKAFTSYGGWIGATAGVTVALGAIFALRVYLIRTKLAPSIPDEQGLADQQSTSEPQSSAIEYETYDDKTA
jgi:membrane protein DedA with SNARE-associated domain